jgi:WD40 repeat protein
MSPGLIGGDNRYSNGRQGGIEVVYEQFDHHNGSIYCVDWSRTSRLVATGSNDKMIKILVTPNFEDESDKAEWSKEAKEMELRGHKAIVRTVCYFQVV